MLARAIFESFEDYDKFGYEDELRNEKYSRPYKLRKLCIPEHGVYEIWTNHPEIIQSIKRQICGYGFDATVKIREGNSRGIRKMTMLAYREGELITEDISHDN